MRLSEILDPRELCDDIRNGYVSVRTDSNDPRTHVLCYTQRTVGERHWDVSCRATRGLVIACDGRPAHDLDPSVLGDALVMARGIPKFFTVEATSAKGGFVRIGVCDDDEGVSLDGTCVLSLDARAVACDKIDGAMAVAFVDEHGRLRASTKGSVQSDEARIATRLLVNADEAADGAVLDAVRQLRDEDDRSAVFEVVSPLVPHVVDYGQREDLTLLGFVGNRDGAWHPAMQGDRLACIVGTDVAATLSDGTLGDALSLPERRGAEGVVVTVDDAGGRQRMFKVKYDAFLRAQAARHPAMASSAYACAQLLARGIKDVRQVDAMSPQVLAEVTGYTQRTGGRLSPSERADETLSHAMRMSLRRPLAMAEPVRDSYEKQLAEAARLFLEVLAHGGSQDDFTAVVMSRPADDRPRLFALRREYATFRESMATRVVDEAARRGVFASAIRPW